MPHAYMGGPHPARMFNDKFEVATRVSLFAEQIISESKKLLDLEDKHPGICPFELVDLHMACADLARAEQEAGQGIALAALTSSDRAFVLLTELINAVRELAEHVQPGRIASMDIRTLGILMQMDQDLGMIDGHGGLIAMKRLVVVKAPPPGEIRAEAQSER